MRATWKGAIGFGLVSIPVSLHVATEEHGLSLHQVHVADGGRIRYRRTCEACGLEVEYRDIARGYHDPDGRAAVLTDQDMAELPLPTRKLIDVVAFVDAADIDPLALGKAYYVSAASPTAEKPYVLLRDALVEGGKAAVAKVALRTRESLALLRVHGDVLVLHTMYWPDEVRSPEGLAPTGRAEVRPQELRMAASLMETLSEDFDLQQLHDDYQHALDELVIAKLAGEHPAPTITPPEAQNVVDLMAALEASIAARRGGAAEPEPPPAEAEQEKPKKRAAKKAGGKKQPRKRA